MRYYVKAAIVNVKFRKFSKYEINYNAAVFMCAIEQTDVTQQ